MSKWCTIHITYALEELMERDQSARMNSDLDWLERRKTRDRSRRTYVESAYLGRDRMTVEVLHMGADRVLVARIVPSQLHGSREVERRASWENEPRQKDWHGRTAGGSNLDWQGGKSTGHTRRRNERVHAGSLDEPTKAVRNCRICHRSR